VRTVGAKLMLDVLNFKRGAKEAQQETKGIEDKLNDAAKAGDKTAKAAADIGRTAPRALKLTERAASELDRQIDDTRRSYEKLRDQFERTGDLSVFEAMGKELAKLDKQLERRRVIFGESDQDSKKRGLHIGANMAEGIASGLSRAGGPVSAALANVFGTLPPQAQMAIGGSLIAAVAMAAPAIGATVAGAAVAGIGSGVVAVGVASAFQDARVKKAGKDLALDLKMMFGDIGQDFAGDTVAAMRLIRSEINRLGLREALAPAAGYLRPLTAGLTGLVRNLMPGLQKAIISAEKPIQAIAAALPRLGTAFSELFEMFSRHAESGAAALTMLFDVIIAGVAVVKMQIDALATMFEFFDKLPTWMTGAAGSWIDASKNAAASTDDWNTSLDGLRGLVESTGAATAAAAPQITTFAGALKEAGYQADWLKQQMDRLNGGFVSLHQAEATYQAALDNFTASIKENGFQFRANTEAGRANIAAYNQLRDAALANAQAAYENKAATGDLAGAQQAGIAVMADARRQFIAAGVAAGQNKEQVEALADEIFGTPKQWKTTFDAATKAASDKITGLQKQIRLLNGKTITITTRFITHGRNAGDLKVPGGHWVKDRWGGMHIPMAAGGITQAGIYRASSPPLISFAEPETGGEAYIPRRGDLRRSRAIWEHVGENWLGMHTGAIGDWSRYRPMTGGGASRVEVVARWVGPPGMSGDIGRALAQWIQLDVWDRGSGDVQRAYGKRA
jgi:hypothetical protein